MFITHNDKVFNKASWLEYLRSVKVLESDDFKKNPFKFLKDSCKRIRDNAFKAIKDSK